LRFSKNRLYIYCHKCSWVCTLLFLFFFYLKSFHFLFILLCLFSFPYLILSMIYVVCFFLFFSLRIDLTGEIQIGLKDPTPFDFEVDFKGKKHKVGNPVKAEIKALDALGNSIPVCLCFFCCYVFYSVYLFVCFFVFNFVFCLFFLFSVSCVLLIISICSLLFVFRLLLLFVCVFCLIFFFSFIYVQPNSVNNLPLSVSCSFETEDLVSKFDEKNGVWLVSFVPVKADETGFVTISSGNDLNKRFDIPISAGIVWLFFYLLFFISLFFCFFFFFQFRCCVFCFVHFYVPFQTVFIQCLYVRHCRCRCSAQTFC
jgi:hypothetical protein